MIIGCLCSILMWVCISRSLYVNDYWLLVFDSYVGSLLPCFKSLYIMIIGCLCSILMWVCISRSLYVNDYWLLVFNSYLGFYFHVLSPCSLACFLHEKHCVNLKFTE